jgi:OFA family oxalate/formate antiporter-like MFS transporter
VPLGVAPAGEPGGPLRGSDGLRPLAAAVVVNAAAGTLFAWSILLAPVRGEFGVGSADLAPVFSTALVGFTLAVLAGGHLGDRLGPRRVVTDPAVVLAGLALLAVAYGAVSALLPLATVGLVVPSRFGVSYGRVSTSWGVGGVVGPVAGAALTEGIGGHVTAFRAALAVAGLAVVALTGFERALAQQRVR